MDRRILPFTRIPPKNFATNFQLFFHEIRFFSSRQIFGFITDICEKILLTFNLILKTEDLQFLHSTGFDFDMSICITDVTHF